MPSLFMFGNKFITRNGIPIVRNDIINSGYTSAAIGGQPKWNGGYNFTTVGTNGPSSSYGTYDQTGNCFEWCDSFLTSSGVSPTGSPVAFYRFENNVSDSAGSYNGTAYNSPSYASGLIGNYCINFTGGSSYVTIPAMISGSFTVSFFVQTTQNYTVTGPFYRGYSLLNAETIGVVRDWGITYLNNRIAFGIGNTDAGTDDTINSSNAINDGQWHHVCCTRDANTGSIKLYLDGNLESSIQSTKLTRNASNVLYIGNIRWSPITNAFVSTTSAGFNGKIDQLKIYNSSLSSDNVLSLMSEGLNTNRINNNYKTIRGGDIYGIGTPAGGYECSKLTRYTKTTTGGSINPSLFTRIPNYAPGKPQDKNFGGRLASSGNPLGLSNYITIGNTGNTADTTGYGTVNYSYQINKYLLTNNEYCNFLNTIATTPTNASTKDVAYGINNQNIIYEINLTDKTCQPVFDTQLVGVITNGLALDTVKKVIYFFDNQHNMYAWALGSTLISLGNINTIASLGMGSSESIGSAAYYNGAIWVFNGAAANNKQLVKINIAYSSSNVPSISSTTKYSTNITGITSTYGDIAINSSGILYGNTSAGDFFSLDVNNPNSSFSLKKTGLTNLQNTFNRDYTTLYVQNYDTGSWSTINLTNGNLTSINYTTNVSVPTSNQPGYGLRDICGPNTVMIYNNLYSYQMNSERVGGINRNYNPDSSTLSYSVKTNYGNKPAYFLSWFDLARYSNWLHNNYGSLESGAYTLNGATTGIISRNPGATYWVPLENEWYKAAYYKATGTDAGYWKFATRSDSTPIEVDASNIGDGTVKKINRYISLPTGINVSTSAVVDPVNNNSVSFIFDRVLSTGITSIIPQPQYVKPGLPANFYLSNTLSSYSINTTASYSGNITVRYTLPSSISSGDFSKIKIFHKNSSTGKFEDATIATGVYARNFSTKTISAIVSNFSPFEVIPEEAPSTTGLILDSDPESSTYNTYISLSNLINPDAAPSGSSAASSISGLSFPPVSNSSAWARRVLVPDPDTPDSYLESVFNVEAQAETVVIPASIGDVTIKYMELTPGIPGEIVSSISTQVSPPSETIQVTTEDRTDPYGPYTLSFDSEKTLVITWD
jgi:hypothetical protein